MRNVCFCLVLVILASGCAFPSSGVEDPPRLEQKAWYELTFDWEAAPHFTPIEHPKDLGAVRFYDATGWGYYDVFIASTEVVIYSPSYLFNFLYKKSNEGLNVTEENPWPKLVTVPFVGMPAAFINGATHVAAFSFDFAAHDLPIMIFADPIKWILEPGPDLTESSGGGGA